MLGQPPAHRDLVHHRVGRLGSDSREPEPLGHRRDDRHRTIGSDRHHAGDAMPLPRCRDCVEVEDVRHLGYVRLSQPRSVRIAVDRDDAGTELTHAGDRAALVPARSDEEDALHRGDATGEGAKRTTGAGRGSEAGSSARPRTTTGG